MVVTSGVALLSLHRNIAYVFCYACQDGSAVAPMVSLDTAGTKELDLLSKDIDDLKRYAYISTVVLTGSVFVLTCMVLQSSR